MDPQAYVEAGRGNKTDQPEVVEKGHHQRLALHCTIDQMPCLFLRGHRVHASQHQSLP